MVLLCQVLFPFTIFDFISCPPLLFFLFVIPAAPHYFPLLSLRNPCFCSVFLSPLPCFHLFPMLLFVLFPITLLSPCSPCCSALFPFTCLSLHTPCGCQVFFSSFLIFFLLSLLLLCLLDPLYSSFSYYPCCCFVFLIPFTFLSICIPCCSALCPFTLLFSYSMLLLCLLVPLLFFLLLSPAAALSCSPLLLFFLCSPC